MVRLTAELSQTHENPLSLYRSATIIMLNIHIGALRYFPFVLLITISACTSTVEYETNKRALEVAAKAEADAQRHQAKMETLANADLAHQPRFGQYDTKLSVYENSSILTDPRIAPWSPIYKGRNIYIKYWTLLPNDGTDRLLMLGLDLPKYRLNRSSIDKFREAQQNSRVKYPSDHNRVVSRDSATSGQSEYDVASVERLINKSFGAISVYKGMSGVFNSAINPTKFVFDIDQEGYPVNIEPLTTEIKGYNNKYPHTPDSLEAWTKQLTSMLESIQFEYVAFGHEERPDRKDLVVEMYLEEAPLESLIYSGRLRYSVNEAYGWGDSRTGVPNTLLGKAKLHLKRRQEHMLRKVERWENEKNRIAEASRIEHEKRATKARQAAANAKRVKAAAEAAAIRQEAARKAEEKRKAYEQTPEGKRELAERRERERKALDDLRKQRIANGWPADAAGKLNSGAIACDSVKSAIKYSVQKRLPVYVEPPYDCDRSPRDLFIQSISPAGYGYGVLAIRLYGASGRFYVDQSDVVQ